MLRVRSSVIVNLAVSQWAKEPSEYRAEREREVEHMFAQDR